MTDLTIGGETFNVLIEGDETQPVVMLSHSLGASLRMWDAQMPALLEHFRVLRYDLRGHGGSVVSEGPYSLDRLGRDAVSILDALGIDTVHWIGISMGGAVGQWLLINAPDRIERAVLANTAAEAGQPERWNQRIVATLNQGVDSLVAPTLQRWFSDTFARDHADHVASIEATLRATPPRGYAACCAAMRDFDLRESIRGIRHPVLVVAGRDDLAFSKDQTDHLAETIAGAKSVTLETRHISNVEDAAGFNAAVVSFLTAKVTSRRAPRGTSLPSVQRRSASRRVPVPRAAVIKVARGTTAKIAAPGMKRSKSAASATISTTDGRAPRTPRGRRAGGDSPTTKTTTTASPKTPTTARTATTSTARQVAAARSGGATRAASSATRAAGSDTVAARTRAAKPSATKALTTKALVTKPSATKPSARTRAAAPKSNAATATPKSPVKAATKRTPQPRTGRAPQTETKTAPKAAAKPRAAMTPKAAAKPQAATTRKAAANPQAATTKGAKKPRASKTVAAKGKRPTRRAAVKASPRSGRRKA